MEKVNDDYEYECISTVITAEIVIPAKKVSIWKIESETKKVADDTGCFIDTNISEVEAIRKQEDSKLPKSSNSGLSYKISAYCLKDKVELELWVQAFLKLAGRLAKKAETDLVAIVGKKAYRIPQK